MPKRTDLIRDIEQTIAEIKEMLSDLEELVEQEEAKATELALEIHWKTDELDNLVDKLFKKN